MELIYFKDPKFNFGDDLNEHIWKQVLPKAVQEREDLVMVGIGSVLTSERLDRFVGTKKRVAVMGTGISYGVPPKDMTNWHIGAVRGPMSAAVLGRPETAVTDGAILLADTNGLFRTDVKRDKVLFMPHRSSLLGNGWAKVASEAGMEYVSPQTDTLTVLAKFSEARLVVTEAMHGAIVADTLRIPWVPVVINPQVDEFKWRDWSRSMAVEYQPLQLPAVQWDDAILMEALSQNLKDCGIVGHEMLREVSDAERLREYLQLRFSPTYKQLWRVGPLRRLLRAVAKRSHGVTDRMTYARSTRALAQAGQSRSYLSSDEVFFDRLGRMRSAISHLESFALAG